MYLHVYTVVQYLTVRTHISPYVCDHVCTYVILLLKYTRSLGRKLIVNRKS